MKDFSYKVNDEIDANEIILIDQNGNKVGQVSRDQGLEMARKDDLDLVQMNSSAVPVTRIMDHGKFIFNKTVQQKKQKNKHTSTLKEIKIYTKIADADYNVKIKKILLFLEKYNKVKIIVFLKGREKRIPKVALDFLSKILNDLPDTMPISAFPSAGDPMPFSIVIAQKKK